MEILGAAFGGFRFLVQIEGIHNLTFSEFRLPSLQVDVEKIQEGGQNTYIHQLPIRVNVGTVSLRHGLTRDMSLLNWYLDVMNGNLDKAYRQVTVVLVDSLSIPVAIWNFRNAYPVKWSGPSLKSDSSEVAFEEIEFVYHGFEVELNPRNLLP
ncbi:MAG: phage tail protein [Chloroflexota bacterium]|nr:phage tail protein [Chloroflexota bacterium]